MNPSTREGPKLSRVLLFLLLALGAGYGLLSLLAYEPARLERSSAGVGGSVREARTGVDEGASNSPPSRTASALEPAPSHLLSAGTIIESAVAGAIEKAINSTAFAEKLRAAIADVVRETAPTPSLAPSHSSGAGSVIESAVAGAIEKAINSTAFAEKLRAVVADVVHVTAPPPSVMPNSPRQSSQVSSAAVLSRAWIQPSPMVLKDLRTIASVCVGGDSGALLEYTGVTSSADESMGNIETADGSATHKIRTAKRRAAPPLPLLPQPLVLTWFSCEGNLHHFFRETWSPLFLTLERLGTFENPPKLPPSVAFGICHPGSFIYPVKGSGSDDDRACKGDRYKEILDMLPIEKSYERNCVSWPDSVTATPGGSGLQCFENAVVQFGGSPEPTPGALRFVLQNSLRYCREYDFPERPNITRAAPVRILIQQRLHRRLLNADELRDRIMTHPTLGAAVTVRIEVLDDKPLGYQLALAACYTEVLIGVHGAGLQWGVFMGNSPVLRPRGALIELSSQAFGQYYSSATWSPIRAAKCLCNQEDVENKTTLQRFSKGKVLDAQGLAKFADKRIADMESVLSELVKMIDFVRLGGCSDFRSDCGGDRQPMPDV